jgi:hypothetical protein
VDGRKRVFVRALATLASLVALAAACGGDFARSTSAHAGSGQGASSASSRAPRTKVDLLLDVDNSPSMGSKQAYLMQALPELVERLIDPYCLDPSTGGSLGHSSAGLCASGVPEFAAVNDLHLAVITSSLGPRLSGVAPRQGNAILCDPNASALPPFENLSAHNDDQAHLVARALVEYDAGVETESQVVDAVNGSYTPAPGGFLAWAPRALPAGHGPSSSVDLESDFAEMIGGAGTSGCGIESPLESWYRFLVQPDPYADLVLEGQRAAWSGVDAEILRQRHDFLRPDSLVVVVVASDENDSEIDVRSLGGQGYLFMGSGFQVPRGTSSCAVNPQDPACVSCSTVPPGDPTCADGAYVASNDWGFDPNLRHVHMKQKYGVDAQYPIQRYAVGLTSPVIPDRNGEYPAGATNYRGFANCVNPLFAAALPDGSDVSPAALCDLAEGTRTADDVTLAVIGGVPSKLLHFSPGHPQESALTDADWVRILGRGQAAMTVASAMSYDYDGIDPHMIEDYRDRTTVAYPFTTDPGGTNSLIAAKDGGYGDPTNGHEWVTDQPYPGPHVVAVDLQYACIYDLPQLRDCSLPENASACDCPSTPSGLSPQEIPPVCGGNDNPTLQFADKAYPTPRQLLLARLLGAQAVVGSLCPVSVTDDTGSGPLYGYRPVMSMIGDRLGRSLGPGVTR